MKYDWISEDCAVGDQDIDITHHEFNVFIDVDPTNNEEEDNERILQRLAALAKEVPPPRLLIHSRDKSRSALFAAAYLTMEHNRSFSDTVAYLSRILGLYRPLDLPLLLFLENVFLHNSCAELFHLQDTKKIG